MTQITITSDLTKKNTTITVDGRELKSTIAGLVFKMNNHTKGVTAKVKMPTLSVKKSTEGGNRTSIASREYDFTNIEDITKALENQDFWERHATLEVAEEVTSEVVSSDCDESSGGSTNAEPEITASAPVASPAPTVVALPEKETAVENTAP